jgi:hypothetical protein
LKSAIKTAIQNKKAHTLHTGWFEIGADGCGGVATKNFRQDLREVPAISSGGISSGDDRQGTFGTVYAKPKDQRCKIASINHHARAAGPHATQRHPSTTHF